MASLGGQGQATDPPQPAQKRSPARPQLPQSNSTASRLLTTSNAAAGVKRKSEEPETVSRPKTAKMEETGNKKAVSGPTSVSRFQLSAKSGTLQKSSTVPNRPLKSSGVASSTQQANSRPTSAGSISANGPAPQRRGFAYVMEKAKAAQDAARVTTSYGIKHKPVEKRTERDRQRLEQ